MQGDVGTLEPEAFQRRLTKEVAAWRAVIEKETVSMD